MTAVWDILGVCLAIADFRLGVTNTGKNRSFSYAMERDECLNTAVRLLKRHGLFILPIHAVYRAKIYKLESNDDVLWICAELASQGHGDPFEKLDDIILPSERLEFFQWSRKFADVDLSGGGGFMRAFELWPEHKGRPLPENVNLAAKILIWPHTTVGEQSKSQLPPHDND